MPEISFRDEMLDALERSGMSLAELSRRSGVSYDVLNKLKRRPGSSTVVENASAIKLALGIGADDVTENESTLDATKSELEGLSEEQLKEVRTFVQFVRTRNGSGSVNE